MVPRGITHYGEEIGVMEIKVFKSIKEVEEKEWNSIVSIDRIICTYRYLRAIEESSINDCDFRYLVAYRNGKVVAHTCIYSMSFNLDIFTTGVIQKINNGVRHMYPRFLKMRLVECGTPTALGNTISYAEGVDRVEILNLFIEKMEKFAQEKGIGLLGLRDFTEEEVRFYDILRHSNFSRVNNLPNTTLKLTWDSFDDYIGSLRSNYRYKIKKNMKKSADEKIEIEVLDNFSEHAEVLCRLWVNVYERAKEYKREILTPNYFKSLSRYLENKALVITVKKDGEIVGFSLVLLDDLTLRYIYSGLTYEYNKDFSVYFNMLYEMLKFAIDTKKRKFEMGITTYIPKLDIGARIEPFYVYLRHRNSILNFIIPKAFDLFTPNNTYKPRNVFRQ
jgi:predicted N-acyltransferase